MLFHPAILSLLLGSILISAMLVTSAFYGVQILRKWDIGSGRETQLSLERRTYLISTVMNYAFGFQLASLFLFIYTADALSSLFVGAMCAAGSLNVNDWGYPTIVLKIVNAILAGIWLIVNFTDSRGYDYPLIKAKYALLIFITPFMLTEMIFQGNYFLRLKPDVIVSCCGALFGSGSDGLMPGIVALPHGPVEVAFYSSMAATLLYGIYFYTTNRWAYGYSAMTLVTFLVGVTALIAFISLYFYELPTHHCPFCILQREYLYVGYPLYVTLLGTVTTGLGIGAIAPFRKTPSLVEVVPLVQRRLTTVSLIATGLYLIIVLYGVTFSKLSLRGY